MLTLDEDPSSDLSSAPHSRTLLRMMTYASCRDSRVTRYPMYSRKAALCSFLLTENLRTPIIEDLEITYHTYHE